MADNINNGSGWDKNSLIGFGLIGVIALVFTLWSRPSAEQIAARQHAHDSIVAARNLAAKEQLITDSLNMVLREQAENESVSSPESVAEHAETLRQLYGPFAPSAEGEEGEEVLENSRVRLHIARKGGVPCRAELKEYHAYGDTLQALNLFRANETGMAFTLVTSNNRVLTTDNLYFEPIRTSDSTLTMRLRTSVEDSWLDMEYVLPSNEYMVGIRIVPHNVQNVLAQNMTSLAMLWEQRIPQQERGRKFEERYARLQYMLVNGTIEQLSEGDDDSRKEAGQVRWIAYKDQFFSTVLIADDAFMSSGFTSKMEGRRSRYIKNYHTTAWLPFSVSSNKSIGLRLYLGPNHYNTLKAYDEGVERSERLHLNELVPLGWKIVSWINKILVIPMFDLFTSWGLHIGLVILLMTVVIKLIILPFVFASYRSSAKMRVLRPQLEAINEKYPPEKMQERQQATMALYSKAGVSPMSGCLPMLFQFPVLMAMFWFFPTAIELRGQSFLWAEDLSTYDAILSWGRDIWPIGDHLSLFCILMTVTNIAYTYVTMQSQAVGNDPSAKMMRWMMYLMPLMFFFIFNDYAAGLSYYYLLSLFFTILQTMIFRWSINDEKLLREMEENAKKRAANPKKKSGFMARLEEMQREQQRMARENAKKQQRKVY